METVDATLIGFGQPHAQAPRLTTMLRTFISDVDFDIDQAYIAREQAMAKRNVNIDNIEKSKVLGNTGLFNYLFGKWRNTPRKTREAYEAFLKVVGELVEGEISSDELQESSLVVWRGCEELAPKKEILNNRGFHNRQLDPLKEELEGNFGYINLEVLKKTVLAYYSLKENSEKFKENGNGSSQEETNSNAMSSRQGSSNSNSDSNMNRGEKLKQSILMDEEFGSDLKFNFMDGSKNSEDLVLSICQITPNELIREMKITEPKDDFPSLPTVKEIKNIYANARNKLDEEKNVYQLPSDDESGSETDLVNGQVIDINWLKKWMDSFTDSADMQMAVCQALLKIRNGDHLVSELCGLFGWDTFDSIQELSERRHQLHSALIKAIGKARDIEESKKVNSTGIGIPIKISIDSEKRKINKERKSKKKNKGIDADADWLYTAGFDAILDPEPDSKIWLFDNQQFQVQSSSDGNRKGALPKGTSRKAYKGHEEVHVPAPSPAPRPEGSLVSISNLDSWAQVAFEGYDTLNLVQSQIFNTAFNSNENILVCAPTGAGKTNIAMITVLREIGLHMKYGIIQKSEFKIVYVAPMKALAAEMTDTFSRRLAALGMVVKELTGDMQLSKWEMANTQMIVTTPEKWDVITRKGGDVSVASLVRLLIIDEIHLLNDDRGPVIETLVARTLRQVEVSQSMIRIVGLSATLPNYKDVAQFLSVNVDTGLFYFDASYRPIPLALQFIGISESNFLKKNALMHEICFEKIASALRREKQVMVFVHSRKDTVKTARILHQLAAKNNNIDLFDSKKHQLYNLAVKEVQKSRNKDLVELFNLSFGIHHAGMMRSDRRLTENYFTKGILRVIVCTATLAWGVNLPAHTVIIKGTQLYDPQKGKFSDLGMLDVQQIFGRAGRPQFDSSGEAVIITSHDKLAHYLGMLTHQLPIESQFISGIIDHLNAEIVLGTVSTIKEACIWLSYTYMYVRMLKNPLVYGISWEQLLADRNLEEYRMDLARKAARTLEKSRMARFDERSGQLYVTELGRVASHYYIHHDSIQIFNAVLSSSMSESEILCMISEAKEFEHMMVREEELIEMEMLLQKCPYQVRGGVENPHGKVNILIQAFVTRLPLEGFSLIADMMYVSKNAPRICRALFEICIRRGWSTAANTLLNMCKALEHRIWPFNHPLRQFETTLPEIILTKLESYNLSLDDLYELEEGEIYKMVKYPNAGKLVRDCLETFPYLELNAKMQPLTRSVLQLSVEIATAFKWREKQHGNMMKWLLWVEDSENEHIYHQETWILTKGMMKEEKHKLSFAIPLFEPLPSQYYIRIINDSWLGSESLLPITFKTLILPQRMAPHTELLDLIPLPLSALKNILFESLYSFSHFNPIQTQVFHTLYHTDRNVLLGAPTGSGKTISAELAMLRVFQQQKSSMVVYIAPLKALVRERLQDWGNKLCKILNKKIIELTGDYTPDIRALTSADIIIATPEKWDGISRNWQTRPYVKKVGLMVIDEIHLLGGDRGPIIEVIVSRMRYISCQTNRNIRFLGLSTALANAQDVAEWMGVEANGLYNFKPSVRPVPLECHIQGYAGKHYCPRMATMNKPAYAAIQTHSPFKPVLVFVSSRRQTRLTALDLITFSAADGHPEQFLRLTQEEIDQVLLAIKDENLKHTLQFGIGLHHAGLNDEDRSIVENLFVEQRIQVLVATSTLAWGVNTPAHLVIVKGTEYYDAKLRRYVDFPITDVLQMMGRAGRPQYDHHGVAVIMVHEPKKQFYKKFIYEPFPVESSLPQFLADHINAEIVAGTIRSKQDALDYLTWTYFFRRLLQNPSFYNLEGTEPSDVNKFLSDLVEKTLESLTTAGCLEIDEGNMIIPLTMGRIASYYYLKHDTMAMFSKKLSPCNDLQNLLNIMCQSSEYDDFPVRHNEDRLNTLLAQQIRWQVDLSTVGEPYTKANLLLQAHMSRMALPISDYVSDTKSVLDNSIRILQAMVDITADAAWLATTLKIMNLMQCLMQARWLDDSSLLMVPHMTEECVLALAKRGIFCLPQLVSEIKYNPENAKSALVPLLGEQKVQQVLKMCRRLPNVAMEWREPYEIVREEGEEGLVEMALDVRLRCRRLVNSSQGRSLATAFAPRFPKIKDEGWWLVLGDTNTKELHALKRVSIRDSGINTSVTLKYTIATETNVKLTLFLISDCYLGFDQQYDI